MLRFIAVVFAVGSFSLVVSRPQQANIKQKAQEFASIHPNLQNGQNDPEYGDLFEGDIIVDNFGEKYYYQPSNPLNAVANTTKRWPNNQLFYEINPGDYTLIQLDQIHSAIQHLQDSTRVNGELCIELIERNGQYDHSFVSFDSGCSSYVGRRGGRQYMSLVESCVNRNGTIMHEFLHALGFHHEHKRSDRDDYVIINWDNIEPGYEHNFDLLENGTEVNLLGTPYDYGSVMHYSAYSFAIDDAIPTIIPHPDPNVDIGQRTHLSDLDIERVQIFYECLNQKDSKYFKNVDLSEFWALAEENAKRLG